MPKDPNTSGLSLGFPSLWFFSPGPRSNLTPIILLTVLHVLWCLAAEKFPGMGRLGGSAVEHLPSAPCVILETQDRVPHQAPSMEPASPSACVSASLSLSVSLVNK